MWHRALRTAVADARSGLTRIGPHVLETAAGNVEQHHRDLLLGDTLLTHVTHYLLFDIQVIEPLKSCPGTNGPSS